MNFRKFLGAALAALLSTSALAQVNVVPQVGVNSAVITRNTYSAVALALPLPASPQTITDIACIAGSATKTVYINFVGVSGTAGTLTTTPVTLLRRAAVDTGGTPATTTANWANTIARNDTRDPTATATLISYSANPTINDTSPTYLRSRNVTFPTIASGTVLVPIVWEWDTTSFGERPTLRGTSEQICVNLNSATVSSGVLQLTVEWTEE